MRKYSYTLKRHGVGWYWEVIYPKETPYAIGIGTSGWCFTKWGAKWAITKVIRKDIRSIKSKERGQVVVRD